MDTTSISKNIQNYRLRAGLSVKELAKKCEITPGHLNNIERGIGVIPTLDTLNVMSKVLNVEIDRLLEGCLTIYKSMDVESTQDINLLKIFYSLPIEKKECVIGVVRALNIYQGMNDKKIQEEEKKDISIDLRHQIKSSTYIQEILAELLDLNEDQQRCILDVVRSTAGSLRRMKGD